jgi:hypothetical protein
VLSGNVLSISKTKRNVSVVHLKTRSIVDGKMMQNRGIPIIVNGDLDYLCIDDPIAFVGYIVPDRFNPDGVCMMAKADHAFEPEGW